MKKPTNKQKYLQIDPTRTKTLRTKFERQMYKRLSKLKGLIVKSIVQNDALALKTNVELPRRAFEFRTLDEKHVLFMEWLREQERLGILEITRLPLIGGGREWTQTFIQSAYQKGILRARQELRAQGVDTPEFTGAAVGDSVGVAFNMPVHSERAQLIYSRVFTELKGITSQMDSAISRELAQGMIEGQSPRVIARRLNKEVDIGIMRSRRLARTEVVRAHHSAMMAEYRMLGAEGVEIMTEFLTAGDGKVCIKCASLAGKRFTLDEAENLIPVHPNCRCTAIPVVEDQIKNDPYQTPEQIKKIAGLE